MNSNRKPQYHVAPWKNWCNDPNGLIFDGRRYHAFYQHYPDDHAWGPMHWGHMVSDDLYRWEHCPISLFPGEDYCFSGSAVMDWQNTSGLAKEGQSPMLLFYTGHPAEPAADGLSYQRQFMAYSYDGIKFTPYANNPVLPNNGRADFRDPKVFRYEAENCWIMLLAAGDHIAFYRSENLLDWNHISDFGPAENTISGVWECPDLFPLEFEEKIYWILIVSMGATVDEGRAVTQYFVGDFDGQSFSSLRQTNQSRLIDEGTDNYAAVSFYGTGDILMMGWAMNWGYADRTPTEGWCGQMTAVRKMSLYRDLDGHISLAAWPTDLSEETIQKRFLIESEHFAESRTIDLPNPGSALVLGFVLNSNQPAFELVFSNRANERVLLRQDNERNLLLDRSASGELAYMGELQQPLYLSRSILARTALAGHFTLMLDGPVLEVYADDGTRVLTTVLYPSSTYDQITIQGIPTLTIKQLSHYKAPMAAGFYLNKV